MTDCRVSIIAAMDRNKLIGNKNRMPWNIPEDLAFFRRQTLDHPVIMGKNTWLSLGKTLDRRTNIILTHDTDFRVDGAIVFHTIQDCLEHCSGQECYIIGGAQIFSQFLPLASKLVITRIDYEFAGDTCFPDFDLMQWNLDFFEAKTSTAGYNLTFSIYSLRC